MQIVIAQASRDAIFSVVDSLAVTLDVGGVFKGVPSGPSYALRTVVCYFGHHYQVQRPALRIPSCWRCRAVLCYMGRVQDVPTSQSLSCGHHIALLPATAAA